MLYSTHAIVHDIIWEGGLYLGEVPEYFRHFVSSLTASDVDNDVTVGIFRQRLWDDRLTAAERTWNGSRAALDAPADIQNTLDL